MRRTETLRRSARTRRPHWGRSSAAVLAVLAVMAGLVIYTLRSTAEADDGYNTIDALALAAKIPNDQGPDPCPSTGTGSGNGHQHGNSATPSPTAKSAPTPSPTQASPTRAV